MEDNYYFCLMSLSSIRTYFKNNIAELKTPKLSLGSDILIGSSDSQSSISDFIENKTKCVGLQLRRSMLQSTLPNIKLMHAMIRKLSCDLTKFGKWVGTKYAAEKVG